MIIEWNNCQYPMMLFIQIPLISNDNSLFRNFLYAIIHPNSMTGGLFSSPAVRWLLNLSHSDDQTVQFAFRV